MSSTAGIGHAARATAGQVDAQSNASAMQGMQDANASLDTQEALGKMQTAVQLRSTIIAMMKQMLQDIIRNMR